MWCSSLFESSVNSEGIETHDDVLRRVEFESSVNSEGIETHDDVLRRGLSLRAV